MSRVRLKDIAQAAGVSLSAVSKALSGSSEIGSETRERIIKLSTELSKRSTGNTFYVLDEPTTGLHTADVHRLLDVLNRLTDAGNTIVVIEHNLDVIKTADHLIDLGPEGGDAGGELLFEGTPEDCAKCEKSYTGHYLNKVL